MATKVTFYTEGGVPSNGQVLGVKMATVDFAVDAAAISDVYTLFDMDASEIALAAGYSILTADAGGATIDIGIAGGDTDIWEDGGAISSTGTVAFDALPAARTAQTVQLQVLTAAASAGKIQVWVVVARVYDPATPVAASVRVPPIVPE